LRARTARFLDASAGDEGVAAASGNHPCPVGGHPAELLVIELDEHPGRQRVDPGQQCAGIRVIAGLRSDLVPAGDQPGQPGQATVPAAPEVGQRTRQPGAQPASGHLGGARREAEHRIPYPGDEQLSAGSLARRGSGAAADRCGSSGSRHGEACQELTSPQCVFTILPARLSSHGRGGHT